MNYLLPSTIEIHFHLYHMIPGCNFSSELHKNEQLNHTLNSTWAPCLNFQVKKSYKMHLLMAHTHSVCTDILQSNYRHKCIFHSGKSQSSSKARSRKEDEILWNILVISFETFILIRLYINTSCYNKTFKLPIQVQIDLTTFYIIPLINRH